MEKGTWDKTFFMFLAGMLGSFVLGFVGFLTGLYYGGNFGCFHGADFLFGTAGYESCGSLGATLGWIFGAFFGIGFFARKEIASYRKASRVLFLVGLCIPALLFCMTLYLDYAHGSVEPSEMFLNVSLFTVLLATPSFLAMLLLHLFKFCKKFV